MPRRRLKRRIGSTSVLRAVIYLRVSTDMQVEDGFGLDAQLDNCLAYALKHGYEIVGTKEDKAISGTKGLDVRKGLDDALQMCRDKKADVFLCSALDRQSRDNELFFAARKELQRIGVPFVTVKEDRDFTARKNLLMGDIYAAFAAEERRRIAGRLLDGRTQRSKLDGRGSGYLPYAYELDAQDKIVVNPEKANIVRRILLLRDDGLSYRMIATALNEEGILSPKNKKWRHTSIKHITDHRDLYVTGVRKWVSYDDDDNEIVVVAREIWPTILQEKKDGQRTA